MSVEAVINTLVNVAGVTSIVGANYAMTELPQDAGYPALVWTPISGVPVLPINASSGPQLKRSRVQFTCLARDQATLLALRDALRVAMNYQRGVIAGVTVVSITHELDGPHGKDDEAKVFMQPVDYMVTHYDA